MITSYRTACYTAQILLRWAVSRGTIPIPKSAQPEHIAENIDIFDFGLTSREQDAITALDQRRRFVDPFEWWGVPYFG